MPDEDESPLSAATAIGAEEAIGAVGDGGLHRTPAHLHHKVVASETDVFRHRKPTKLVGHVADGPVGTERPRCGHKLIHRGMRLVRVRLVPGNETRGSTRSRGGDLSPDL